MIPWRRIVGRPQNVTEASPQSRPHRSLFRKYVGLFLAVICIALISPGPLELWFAYRQQQELLLVRQRELAVTAAGKLAEFIKEIEHQLEWTTQLSWPDGTLDDRRFDAQRLLRQVPAIAEVVELDPDGREQLRVSRFASDVIGSNADFSNDPRFTGAMADKIYFGPAYFRFESEPYMSVARAGNRREDGVTIAEVNLKFIWDVISQFKVGIAGQIYVVDGRNRLIGHHDIGLVLRHLDLSDLDQVARARSAGAGSVSQELLRVTDLHGRQVLAAYAPVAPRPWLVFVEMPIEEAYAPLYSLFARDGVLLVVGVGLAIVVALFFSRRMVMPITALRRTAARVGSGDLKQRVSIKTGDEIEELADQFNRMTVQLQEMYATLEQKVEQRTRELELAIAEKSRFIAAASHDLRQPLHALGLFIGRLRSDLDLPSRQKITERAAATIAEMNELFDALLDSSKLDSGVIAPNVTEFPIAKLLSKMENSFAEVAGEKGLSLRVVSSGAWVRSDPILLERILLNLVSNAVRYTSHGGVVLGCRRRGGKLRIEVWDSGPGIPADKRQYVFDEFYQLARGHQQGGLGLGLAIVDRLCRLLDHSIDLRSTVGKGSCFAIIMPMVAARHEPAQTVPSARDMIAPLMGKTIVVIDDAPLVLQGTSGLLRSWGFAVIAAATCDAALAALEERRERPDLIIADYHLLGSENGIEAESAGLLTARSLLFWSAQTRSLKLCAKAACTTTLSCASPSTPCGCARS